MDRGAYLGGFDAPTERMMDLLGMRELLPPEPLTETVSRLIDLDGETIFVQPNDREPKFLYPEPDDRGSVHRPAERDEGVATTIWES